MGKSNCGMFSILVLIVLLTCLTMYSTNGIDRVTRRITLHERSSLEHTHTHKHLRESTKVEALAQKQGEKTKQHVLLKDMSLVQKRAPKWKRFSGYDASPDESMGHSNHVSPLADIQVDAERLGASGFTISNGWVWFHRNVGKKHAKYGAELWVNTAADSRPRYGCSRHAHACFGSPKMGSAPCCTEVMKLIMEDMTSQLRKHNVHWRIASGQMLSILRDGVLSMFDHDFDPIFEAGKQQEAIRIIAESMHLSGKPSKWRDADYYYTRQLAAKLRTNWSKYEVVGGDFNWENPKFRSQFALQQTPTSIDIGQAHGTPPQEHNTFRCSPAFDVLCLRDWSLEASQVYGGGITRRPSWISNEQWSYAGYDKRIDRTKGAMYNGMALTSHSERDEIARRRVKEYPNYWKRTAKQEETHHVIYNTTKSHVQHTAHVIPVQKRAVQMSDTEEGWSSDICTPVYFLGGGKAGSTTLAMLLKHGAPSYATWDPNGQFADSEKEVCWAESGTTSRGYWRHFHGCTTSKRKLFALDACPRYYSDTHLRRIARVHPTAKFIMLVREPANRIVSHLNDHALRYGVSFNFESRFKQVIDNKHSLEWELSQYSKMLQTFLKYFDSNQILIVKTEDLNAYTKEIVSEIMEHIGGTNKEITPIESNRLNKRTGYRRPSSSTLQHARDIMRPGVEWLREHTDIHIGWPSFGVKQKTNPLVRHIGRLSSKNIDLYPDNSDGGQSVTTEVAHPKKLTCNEWEPSTNTKWTINRCSDKPFNMAVHSIPDIVSANVIKTGCWEKHILKRVVDHMKTLSSGLFLDVGANIGAFTATVANNGHEVIAVEPFYMNIPIIQSTVCQQHMEKVHLYKIGVSDTSPGQKMCIWSTNSHINNGNARMTPYFEGRKDFGQDKQKECMEVIYTYTLDELLFDVFKLNRPIDAMKIDIEGFETRAFRGAKRLLASPFKPRKIWFEYQKQATIESGVPQFELFEVLAAAGYDVIDFAKSSVALRAPHWGHINIGDFEATLREVPNKFTAPDNSVVEENSVVSIPNPSMCAVILACNRPDELSEALSSWSNQLGLPVTISMDCESPESDKIVDEWVQKQPLWRKIDSFQRDKKETFSEERIARHWVSSLARMFRRPECDYVIYAEEDQIVSGDFFDSAKTMVSAFDMCPTCWSMNMGCHRDCWGKRESNPSAVIRMESGNMGVIYTREGFRKFMDHIDIFCEMRGNWDNNVHSMAALGHIKPHSLTFLHSRIHHLSTCRSSRTGITHETYCDWSRETADFLSKDRRVKGSLIDRGVAPHGRGNKHYARANALMKQKCLIAASDIVPKHTSIKHQTRHSVAVAVPVYNRIGYAKLCAAALKDTILSERVYVFDDHSTEFSVDDLKNWFNTSNVRRNKVRLKADKQARAIMEWFVETEYDWLVTLDSDLIVRPDWLSIFEKHVSQTQGVVSLYHSGNIKNHPTGACADGLCEMRSLGNAGVAWSRPLAKRMLARMQNRDGFDWGWTEWLQKQGIPQYAFEESLALHIGMHGTWGIDSTRELSLGFDMSTLSEEIRLRAAKFLNGKDPNSS